MKKLNVAKTYGIAATVLAFLFVLALTASCNSGTDSVPEPLYMPERTIPRYLSMPTSVSGLEDETVLVTTHIYDIDTGKENTAWQRTGNGPGEISIREPKEGDVYTIIAEAERYTVQPESYKVRITADDTAVITNNETGEEVSQLGFQFTPALPAELSPQTPESALPFEAGIGFDKDRYLPGEQVMYGVGIINLSSGTITIDPFPPAMWIKPIGEDEPVYSSEVGNRTLDIGTDYPDSWYRSKGLWDQKGDNGEQVAPGWYEIGYEYVIIEQNTRKRYTANPTAKFQIVHPDSAMNKDLDVNRSVTAEGITVTLERIEFNAVEVTVYIFTTPPGYKVPQAGQLEEHSSFVRHSVAEYSVDGGVTKQPVDIGAQFNESGARLIWDLDPNWRSMIWAMYLSPAVVSVPIMIMPL